MKYLRIGWGEWDSVSCYTCGITATDPEDDQEVLFLDLVKFVLCILVSRVHMPFYILTKGYTVPGNQGTHDKLNQIQKLLEIIFGIMLIIHGSLRIKCKNLGPVSMAIIH